MDDVAQTFLVEQGGPTLAGRLAGFATGLWHPEDIVPLEGTTWIIVSAMRAVRGRGALLAVDSGSEMRAVELEWLPAAEAGRIGRATFDPHGIDVRKTGEGRFELLVVDHGGGEAIDRLTLEIRDGRPVIAGGTRIEKPTGTSGNAVAFMPQGGFAMTSMFDPGDPDFIGKFANAETTGGVWRWDEAAGWRRIGPELSGANGIAVSRDGGGIVVSEWAARRVWRLSSEGAVEARMDVDFLPDNLRWNSDGTLLLAGQTARPEEVFGCLERGACPLSFKIVRVDPNEMRATSILDVGQVEAVRLGFGGATGALEVGGEIWVASFIGEKVARFRPDRLR